MNAGYKQQGEDKKMDKRIKIKQVSVWSIGLTCILAV